MLKRVYKKSIQKMYQEQWLELVSQPTANALKIKMQSLTLLHLFFFFHALLGEKKKKHVFLSLLWKALNGLEGDYSLHIHIYTKTDPHIIPTLPPASFCPEEWK